MGRTWLFHDMNAKLWVFKHVVDSYHLLFS